jgi:hypothetical protein
MRSLAFLAYPETTVPAIEVEFRHEAGLAAFPLLAATLSGRNEGGLGALTVSR